jgi:hypothetical protein
MYVILKKKRSRQHLKIEAIVNFKQLSCVRMFSMGALDLSHAYYCIKVRSLYSASVRCTVHITEYTSHE